MNYGSAFPSRVRIHAGGGRVHPRSQPTDADTGDVDLGTKAVAADSAAGHRCRVLGVPDAVGVAHNEEHLVIETPAADRYRPGDGLDAIPADVCPTVALYPRAWRRRRSRDRQPDGLCP